MIVIDCKTPQYGTLYDATGPGTVSPLALNALTALHLPIVVWCGTRFISRPVAAAAAAGSTPHSGPVGMEIRRRPMNEMRTKRRRFLNE